MKKTTKTRGGGGRGVRKKKMKKISRDKYLGKCQEEEEKKTQYVFIHPVAHEIAKKLKKTFPSLKFLSQSRRSSEVYI